MTSPYLFKINSQSDLRDYICKNIIDEINKKHSNHCPC